MLAAAMVMDLGVGCLLMRVPCMPLVEMGAVAAALRSCSAAGRRERTAVTGLRCMPAAHGSLELGACCSAAVPMAP